MRTFLQFWLLLVTLGVQALLAQEAPNQLFGIEDKIVEAQHLSFHQSDEAPLQEVLQLLSSAEDIGDTHWKDYWTGFTHFRRSIYLAYNQNANEDKAKAAAEMAIEILDAIENKNSEDYALLGYVKGFSLQWKSGLAIAKQAAIAGKWVKLAVQADDQNPRAQFAFGNNNFHTPAIFGGGKKADEYITRSIALYKESIPNPLMPSWGMDEAYTMLVRTKLKAKKTEEAETLVAEALERFPENRNLRKLQSDMAKS